MDGDWDLGVWGAARGAAQAPSTGSVGSLGDVALAPWFTVDAVEGDGTGVEDIDSESERAGTGVEAGCEKDSSVGLNVSAGLLADSAMEMERGDGVWLDEV